VGTEPIYRHENFILIIKKSNVYTVFNLGLRNRLSQSQKFQIFGNVLELPLFCLKTKKLKILSLGCYFLYSNINSFKFIGTAITF